MFLTSSDFFALICFHSFCLVFYHRRRWDFAVELRVGFSFIRKIYLCLLLQIDLYQFWKRIVSLGQ